MTCLLCGAVPSSPGLDAVVLQQHVNSGHAQYT